MRSRRAGLAGVMVALAVVLSGCSSHRAAVLNRSLSAGNPHSTLPIDVDSVPVSGADVTVRAKGRRAVQGELIAVDADALYVLDHAELVQLSRSNLINVRLRLATNAIGGWGAVGTASTLTHGVVMLFSAPIFMSVSAVASMSLQSQVQPLLGPAEVDALWQYARFPQGLPPHWRARDSEPAHPAP